MKAIEKSLNSKNALHGAFGRSDNDQANDSYDGVEMAFWERENWL